MRKFILLLFVSLIVSCDNETTQTVEPLEVIEIIQKNGGGTIVYTLPQRNGVLYVKASYVNSQGQEVHRISSKFNNRIDVDGFIGNESVQVALRVYDEDENVSNQVLLLCFQELQKLQFIFVDRYRTHIHDRKGIVYADFHHIRRAPFSGTDENDVSRVLYKKHKKNETQTR